MTVNAKNGFFLIVLADIMWLIPAQFDHYKEVLEKKNKKNNIVVYLSSVSSERYI